MTGNATRDRFAAMLAAYYAALANGASFREAMAAFDAAGVQ